MIGTYVDGIGMRRCATCFYLVSACLCRKDVSVTIEESASNGLELVPLGTSLVVDQVALERRGGPDALTLDDCGRGLKRLKKVYGAVRYWLGDLMNLTETLFTEEASQVIDQELLTEQEVKDFCFVAKSVAATTRAHAPSWEHAKAVARLKPDAQIEWLDRARAEDWSPRKLASEVAQAGAGGKTVMRFWLVVECGTEAKRDALASKLEGEGYGVKRQEALKKVKKPKREKKEVTAQKRKKGAPKRNTRRRVPA